MALPMFSIYIYTLLAGGLGLGGGGLPFAVPAIPAVLGGGGGTALLAGVAGPPLFNAVNRALG